MRAEQRKVRAISNVPYLTCDLLNPQDRDQGWAQMEEDGTSILGIMLPDHLLRAKDGNLHLSSGVLHHRRRLRSFIIIRTWVDRGYPADLLLGLVIRELVDSKCSLQVLGVLS
jgi:hypothetical protein